MPTENAPLFMPDALIELLSAERIAKHYAACLDSVNLINRISAQETITDKDKDSLSRNAEHLNIMLSRTFWTTEDLTVLRDAVTLAKSKIT